MAIDILSQDTAKASAFFDCAERHGFWLFKLQREGKFPPAGTSWKNDSSKSRADWKRWREQGFNLGINCAQSNLLVLDMDVSKVTRQEADDAYINLCKEWGVDPLLPMTFSARGGWHIPVRRPHDFDAADLHAGKTLIKISNIRALAPGEKDGEVIGFKNRGYVVAPGSTFDGSPYQFVPNAPAPQDCPRGFLEAIYLAPIIMQPSGQSGLSEPADVMHLVAVLDSYGEFDTEPEWRKGMGAVKLATGDTEAGLEIARQMSWPEVTNDLLKTKWDALASVETPGKSYYRVGSFIRRYRELTGHDFKVRKRRKTVGEMFADVTSLPHVASPATAPMILPPPPPHRAVSLMARGDAVPSDTEDSLALSFADLHADDLRYVEEWGRWLHWNGTRWTPDKTSSAFNMVREHLRKFAAGLAFQDARKIAMARTVAAVERLGRSDQRIATVSDVWDANIMLLNTPGGVVDLTTGAIRAAQPTDYMTKMTAVAPGGDCPLWQAFLRKSLGGDIELISYIQRMLGYALTGDTREQALFFLYGPGGNGKGVLLNTVHHIMGDYSKTAAVNTFIDSKNDQHSTDLAGLRGARLVTASETEKGRRWAEAKIKSLTGGDTISARFMRQDNFEFVPQLKLIISGNHKPGLRSVDEAIRRRFNLVPFTIKIPEHEKDRMLPERLKAEWPGILGWLIEGCLAWQRVGLQQPRAVKDATDEYLSSEDALGTWIEERCVTGPGTWAPRDVLFASWAHWADTAHEFVGARKQFYEAMRNAEYQELKREGVRGFAGIELAPPPTPTPLPSTFSR